VPIHAEDYVHRIGRTGRAGLEGKAFTIAAPEDRYAVEQIEKLIGHPIPPILVEGLDPVGWAEKDARKRRGRKPAEAKKPSEKAKPREAAEKTEKPRAERKRPERTRAERPRPDDALQPELAVMAERPARREDSPRDEPRHDEHRRPETRREARHDEPRRPETRHDEHRRPDPRRETRHDEPRRAETRHDEPRRDEPRRDDFRRDRYRRDEDLGPAVVGFGDDVPAFMFLRTRPPQAAESRDTDA
jgi:superfamily II DNA/RNA helicase